MAKRSGKKQGGRAAAKASARAAAGRAPTQIRDLEADPQNARKHGARNVGAIVAALQEVGAGRSIVIDEKGRILAGNATIEAAAQAGITKIRVVDTAGDEIVAVRRSGLSRKAKARLALFDNRTAELADGWDLEVLEQLRKDGIPLEGLWNEQELDRLFAKVERDGDPDEVPQLRPTSIKNGDLFELGGHRLVCGDCKDEKLIAKILRGEKVPILVSDPPYCSGGFQEAGRAAGTWGDIAADNLSTRGFIALITKTLEAWRPQTSYVFTDWRMWIPLYDLIESNGLAVRSMIVWNKGTPGLGALWRTQHELVMFASRAKNARIKGRPAIGNVLDIPALDALEEKGPDEQSAVIAGQRTGNKLHYTEKPVALLEQILKNDESSERGNCHVVDPFAGSGTTLMAAEVRGRACYAAEVEPKFCQVIVDRWEAFTGKKAKKVG